MSSHRYEIVVELKGEVLDAEGRAIRDTLKRAGAAGLQDVKVSKRFVVEVDDSKEEFVESLARDYLANPVSETFKIRRL